MAYIDPEGMFGGDRMALLSDSARFAWPWFWCAGNSVGRVELSYKAFSDTVFRQFKKKPTETQFWNWVSEFHECFLLFVYEADEKVWGQWDTSESYLPKYKTKSDSATPAPNSTKLLEWKNEYSETKRKQVAGKCRVLSDSGKFQQVSANSPVYVDIDVDVVQIEKPLSASADGSLPFSAPSEPPTEDEVIAETATRMCARHPAKRRCSVNEAGKRLKTILGKLPKPDRLPKLARIDQNHEGWCDSHDWQKDDGEYAKGLANWLVPNEFRYDLQPPARASPSGERPYKYERDEERTFSWEKENARRRERGLPELDKHGNKTAI